MIHTDRYPARDSSSVSDGDGHAALLLVESLIHGLCEKGILTSCDAAGIVERAISVQHDYAEAAGDGGASMWHAHARLLSIAASLEIDGEEATGPARVPSDDA